MAATSALYTGLSGLLSNQRRLDVIGNNIANVNTTAFKSSRMIFSALYAESSSLGTPPNAAAATGGTNPRQIGHGVMVAGIQRNFAGGALTATGILTDMAIDGEGFFVTQFGGETRYTRDGAFQLNENRQLVTAQGGYVMGWGVDEGWQLQGGPLQALEIPLGAMSVAQATQTIYLDGNLDGAGDVATSGSVHTSGAMFTDVGLTSPLAFTWDPDNPDAVGGAQLDLTVPGNNLFIDDGEGAPLLALEGGAQAIITISGIEKNGQTLGTHTFLLGTEAEAMALGVEHFGSTLEDMTEWMEVALGLTQEEIGGETLGGHIEIDPTGAMVIMGNEGTVQDLDITSSDITVNYGGTTAGDPVAGEPLTQPFSLTEVSASNGESVRTTMLAYDSLGTAVTIHVSMVLQGTREDGGTVWTFLAESPDAAGLGRIVGSGTIQFDASGNLVSASNTTLTIPRDNGSDSPMVVALDLEEGASSLQALNDTTSSIAATSQDGFPAGELVSFAIDDDGRIIGAFTNGVTRTLGQVALAIFANPAGLEDVGGNFFRVGANSGDPVFVTPSGPGAGRVVSGALEMSNVDLSQEFVNMILASTGYQASSRVITTSNEMLDQLMYMVR